MVKKPIYRDGKLIGFRLYQLGGMFGMLTFCGYEWAPGVIACE
jgi:hypothetical protein